MPGLVPGIRVLPRHHNDVDGTRNSGLPGLRKLIYVLQVA